jgi:RNA polymerase sigma factor (sigma-70 family)
MSSHDLPDPDQELPRINSLAAAILGTSEVTLFENLYIAYAPEARKVAQAILGDAELAADAVHNGFLEMLRYLLAGRRWYDPADARGLALRNVRWAALKANRARNRYVVGLAVVTGTPGDDATWARAEARALCDQIVSQLRGSHQTALSLHFGEGLSNIEAARRLGVSVGVFESRLQRAIRAARRAARSAGLLPQVPALAAAISGLLRRRRRTRRPNLIPLLRTLAATAAAIFTVQLATSFGAAGGGGAAPPVASRLVATGPVRAQLDSIDNSVVLDAVVLPSHEVFALARGRNCDCVAVFRSVDQGASWDVAPGPAELPVARSARHAQTCRAATASIYCSGHAVADQVTGDSAGDGALLAVTGHRLLYFRPLNGVLCSADNGLSWTPRCPSGGSGA